jgi:hypothetical protein
MNYMTRGESGGFEERTALTFSNSRVPFVPMYESYVASEAGVVGLENER